MTHKFIVYTEEGKFHSLKKPVQIVFTLTPEESKQRTVPYDPVAWKVLKFESDVDKRQEFEWDSRLAFIFYETKHYDGKPWCSAEGTCYSLSSGQSRTVTKPPGNRDVVWEAARSLDDSYNYGQQCVSVLNKTGASQKIVLEVRNTRDSNFTKIAAYHPLGNGERIVAPSNLILQAYVVSFAQDYNMNILLSEDLRTPLFEVPISNNALPANSTWRLSQHIGGDIRLTNDDVPRLDLPLSTRTLAASFTDMSNRVDRLSSSLADTQNRLTMVETTVGIAQEELAKGQKSVVDIRAMVDEIKTSAGSSSMKSQANADHTIQPTSLALGADPRIPLLESKTIQLTESLDKTGRFLLAMRDFVKDARPRLVELTATVPAISGKLDESVGQTQQDISALKKLLVETESKLTGLDGRVAKVEARVDSGGEDVVFPPVPGETLERLRGPTTSLDPILDFSLDL